MQSSKIQYSLSTVLFQKNTGKTQEKRLSDQAMLRSDSGLWRGGGELAQKLSKCKQQSQKDLIVKFI